VIGAVLAGHAFAGAVCPGQSVRLFTGSVVPGGADAILLQEDATPDGDLATVNAVMKPGRHIRRAGDGSSRQADAAFLHALTCRARSLIGAAGVRHIVGDPRSLALARHIVPIRLAAELNQAKFS
jgi:molybdopterin molybdotransferase